MAAAVAALAICGTHTSTSRCQQRETAAEQAATAESHGSALAMVSYILVAAQKGVQIRSIYLPCWGAAAIAVAMEAASSYGSGGMTMVVVDGGRRHVRHGSGRVECG